MISKILYVMGILLIIISIVMVAIDTVEGKTKRLGKCVDGYKNEIIGQKCIIEKYRYGRTAMYVGLAGFMFFFMGLYQRLLKPIGMW